MRLSILQLIYVTIQSIQLIRPHESCASLIRQRCLSIYLATFRFILIGCWVAAITQESHYNHSCMSLSTETPFELLQKKDRERRLALKHNIYSRDLRHRVVNYDFTHSTVNQQQQHKAKETLRANRITINNSLKKSFFYRKLLNRTIDCRLTSEQFQKVKEKFDRAKQNTQNSNKSVKFREIWEDEHRRTHSFHSLNQYNSSSTTLEVVPKSSEAHTIKPISISMQITDFKKQSDSKQVANISQISHKRKACLTFNLQVLGNKKNLRIKNTFYNYHSKLNMQTDQPLAQNPKLSSQTPQDSKVAMQQYFSSQKTAQSTPMRQCSFFKKIQLQNLSTLQKQQNACLKVSKIGYNIRDLCKQGLLIEEVRQKLRHKPEAKDCPYTSHQQRQIKNSWNVAPDSQVNRYSRKHTDNGGLLACKTKKAVAENSANDIEGWMVGQQGDEFTAFQK